MESEVVFIYLGKSLPKYAISSLDLAQKYSGLKVHLLANKKVKNQLKNDFINFTSLENFYDESRFRSVAGNLSFPHEFRNGFWLKTLERFFVLHQYMISNSVPSVFHAELDQLLFRCDKLVQNLEKSKSKGVFIPFHSRNKAVASVFFCNDSSHLNSFLNFSKNCKQFDNEMHLFALWASDKSQNLVVLPTINSEKLMQKQFDIEGIISLSSSQIGGVVDAAQIGQWVAGEDPRNLPLLTAPKNKHFQYEDSNSVTLGDLIKLRLSLSPTNELFYCLNDGNAKQIFNLHIHSKIHPWLTRSSSNIDKLIELNNYVDPITLPSTRITQIKSIVGTGMKSFLQNPFRVLRNRSKQFFQKLFS